MTPLEWILVGLAAWCLPGLLLIGALLWVHRPEPRLSARGLFCAVVGFGAPLVLLIADWQSELPSPWPFAVLAASAVCLYAAHTEWCPLCERDL